MKTYLAVLEYIQTHAGCDSAEIARGLSLSAAAIRHHLRRLCAEGLTVSSPAPASKPGRTARRYFRVGQSQLLANQSVLRALLTALQQYTPLSEELILSVAEKLAPAASEKPIRKRLLSAVEHLNQKGYAAYWEAGKDGPRIFLRQCPFFNAEGTEPALCKIDAAFLERLTGSAGTLQPIWQQAPQKSCVFSLNQTADSA